MGLCVILGLVVHFSFSTGGLKWTFCFVDDE